MGSVWSTQAPKDASPPARFSVKRVAVIGAGPSGIAAAKYLSAENDAFDTIVVFEQRPQAGGVWNYSKIVPADNPVPSLDPFVPPETPVWLDGAEAPIFPNALYQRLHANIPGDLMNFFDKEFPEDARLYPQRETIEDYLHEYAEDVKHLIRYSHQVTLLRLRVQDGRDQWDLEATSTINGEVFRGTFDAVVVANGHYSTPYIPAMKNITEFDKAHPSFISHSRQYRTNDDFKDKKILVVGNGPSGLDMCRQINEVSRGKTLLSVRHATPPELLEHTGCEEVAEIEEWLVDKKAIRLKDGSELTDIDHVLFCTGFLTSLPFLVDLQRELISTGRVIHGLYQHLFYIKHPTLVFAGLPMRVIPWPLIAAQAAAYSAVWSNNIDLPPVEEMLKWNKKVEEAGGSFHTFNDLDDGKYTNGFHDWVKTSKHPGKEPPRWSARHFWERKINGVAKREFENMGCEAKTMEELGYHFDPDKDGRNFESVAQGSAKESS